MRGTAKYSSEQYDARPGKRGRIIPAGYVSPKLKSRQIVRVLWLRAYRNQRTRSINVRERIEFMQEALQKLEAMPEQEFQNFFKALPERVQLLVRSGFCDWRKVLPEWYVKCNELPNN